MLSHDHVIHALLRWSFCKGKERKEKRTRMIVGREDTRNKATRLDKRLGSRGEGWMVGGGLHFRSGSLSKLWKLLVFKF